VDGVTCAVDEFASQHRHDVSMAMRDRTLHVYALRRRG
jgi:hypothetical protein